MEKNTILTALGEAQELLERSKLENGETQFLPKALYQMDSISHSIIEVDNELLLTDTYRLETLLTMVTEIDGCLQLLKENTAHQNTMNDIFVYIINILGNVFKFCQVAGAICSNQLQEVVENLASLFKLSYQNLKVIVEIVEKYPPEVLSENLDFLQTVVSNLIKCSQVLAEIDIMASVAVWKCIKRLFIIHKDVQVQNVAKFDCLFELCQITCKILSQCFSILEKKDGTMISKYQKVIRFFLGIILLLIKDFKDVMTEESCSNIYHLVHLIQRLSLIETRKECEAKGCSAEYESLSNSLLCVNEPLLKDFVGISGSAQCILGKQLLLNVNDGDREHDNIAYLMHLLDVMEHLSDNYESFNQESSNKEFLIPWMEPLSNQMNGHSEQTKECQSILHVLFFTVERCSDYFFTQRKGFMAIDKSKCLKEVSLYEVVLAKLCMFVLALPLNYFADIESVMLTNVLSESKYCILLASDLWCFISRCGKPDVCLNHFIFLGKLLIHLHDANGSNTAMNNLSLLIQRLFWFLEDKQHEKVVENFPFTPTNIVIWKLIPLSRLCVENKLDVCSQVVKTVTSLMQMKEKKENTDKEIVCGIKCLSIISSSDLYAEVPTDLKLCVNKQVLEFWACFQNVNEDIEMSEPLMVAMLGLTSQLLLSFEGEQIYEVLLAVNDILQNTDSQSFQFACANLLTNLKDIKFPSQNESECLALISKMFQYMLNHPNWLVEDRSMKALWKFAEQTIYSRALVTFLPSSKKKDFASYLKKEVRSMDVPREDLLNAVLQYISSVSEEKDEIPLDDVIGKIEKHVQEFNELTNGLPLLQGDISRIKNIIFILENICS